MTCSIFSDGQVHSVGDGVAGVIFDTQDGSFLMRNVWEGFMEFAFWDQYL